MDITLNFQNINSKEELHTYLQQQLHLSNDYGRNLDALYDCLTERKERYRIRVEHFEELKQVLGDYADTLLRVLCNSGSSVV